jgi:GT2 family glycosyltransferase
VGGFDEDFFCYLEDVDLGFRLRLAGWRSWFVPDAKVQHVGGATHGGKHSEFSIYHGHRNLTWAFVKNLPGPLLWLLLPLHLSMSLVSLVHMICIGQARIFCRSKRDAVLGLPHAFDKRKMIQSERKVSVLNVLTMLNWKLIPNRKLDRFNADS